MCYELKCYVCGRKLDPAARNLNVDGGWAMVPASRAKLRKWERVAAHLCHAGIQEEILRNAAVADIERALDVWNRRELEEAVDVAIASDFTIRHTLAKGSTS